MSIPTSKISSRDFCDRVNLIVENLESNRKAYVSGDGYPNVVTSADLRRLLHQTAVHFIGFKLSKVQVQRHATVGPFFELIVSKWESETAGLTAYGPHRPRDIGYTAGKLLVERFQNLARNGLIPTQIADVAIPLVRLALRHRVGFTEPLYANLVRYYELRNESYFDSTIRSLVNHFANEDYLSDGEVNGGDEAGEGERLVLPDETLCDISEICLSIDKLAFNLNKYSQLEISLSTAERDQLFSLQETVFIMVSDMVGLQRSLWSST